MHFLVSFGGKAGLSPAGRAWLGGSTDCRKRRARAWRTRCLWHCKSAPERLARLPGRVGLKTRVQTLWNSLQKTFDWDSLCKGNSGLMIIRHKQPSHLSAALTRFHAGKGKHNSIPLAAFQRGPLRGSCCALEWGLRAERGRGCALLRNTPVENRVSSPGEVCALLPAVTSDLLLRWFEPRVLKGSLTSELIPRYRLVTNGNTRVIWTL